MVGQHLHHAFRSWFHETESDGTPLLPVPLSKKYKVLPDVLGQGSFAVVKKVIEKTTGEERALKIIAKKPLKDNNENMLREEIAILGRVEHPNIIKMWDLYETKEGVFIVTDLCRGGELFERLVEKVHYNELDARHIVRQIVEGVDYLHGHDIIHRDLKPENILLRDKSEPSSIAISDFGLSRFIPDEGLLMTACGSPQYVSPEVLLGKGYGPAVDLWSTGVIAYALLAGYTPFYGDDQPSLFQQILKMQVEFEPEYWGDVSETAKDFVLHCLCPADRRMTAKQALAHPWLADLPPLHEEASRGCCLKDRALRNLSATRRLRKAVTAVEAVNHLNRLHSLRQQHGTSMPEGQRTLLSIVTNIQQQQLNGASLETVQLDKDATTPAGQENLPDAPNGNGNGSAEAQNDKKRKQRDSAMALDLVVMSVFLPQNWGSAASGKPSGSSGSTTGGAGGSSGSTSGRAGTANVADAVQRTMGGQQEEDEHGADDQDEGKPTAAAGQQGGDKQTSGGAGVTLNTLLNQYKSAEVPASARLDPAVKTREPAKITLSNAWKYVPFLVNQGISIGSALASHAIYGPPKKSWGVEMSVFTRVLRDVANYSEFASIAGLQQFFDLGAFLPTPKDGLITPVTFRVKRRNLRGFLAEADAAEDGKREISGEWVVGKQTWRRLQAEWRNGKQKGKERVILYIHGGAYFVMSAATHRPLTISLSKYTECRVFGINYRLAPDTRFPGALHDCVASFFRLTDDLGIPASNIVLGADSAGGGLALATMMYLRDNGYDLPSGAMLFSPWVDLTMSCDSWETNSEFDYLPMPISGDHMNPVSAYLGDNIDKYLTHPYASPLFGDLHGLPPLLIQCGDAEVLRDEVTLLAHKASLSGVAVRHELYEDCVHVFQAFLFLDASRKALQSARHFVRTALDKRGRKKAAEVSEGARRGLDREMRQNMEDTKGAKVGASTAGPPAPAADGDKDGKGKAARPTGKDEDATATTASADGGLDEIMNRPAAAAADDDDDDEAAEGRVGNPTDEEDWELDRRASGEFASAAVADAAQKAAAGSLQAAQKAFGHDDDFATRATSAGRDAVAKAATGGGDDDEVADESDVATPMARASPKQGHARLASEGSATSSGGGSSSSSFPAITIEEARLRGQAAMQQQLSTHAPALSKFHAPQKPLTPRMRRSQSGRELSGLIKSFEESKGAGKALKTNVWTPGGGYSEGDPAGGGGGGGGQ
ncbi:uncharacterized protein PFL1_06790 [Pseudozyma flocculosa PF-1]|uniref:Protein kinase domain-containing protein n=1 Tax=Pseudozyma flocculosa PF-1 TaxID=1277687 RepID=A0A061H0N2_9BASI|nr:uncharacterized protein PFL1_06790 [Pseudozyma flocculosa PF-1]EPQ25653.1 hypothetical protein PFL1_06790 [Pseudozyma flocculosa PF-1]